MSDDRHPTNQNKRSHRRRRRRRRRKSAPLDLAPRINRPLSYKTNGVEHRGTPVEVGLLSQVTRAVKGDMRAARQFLLSCERCGLIKVPVFEDDHRYVLRIPKDWDHDEWMAMYDQHGPPPWKGERDGLVRDSEGNPVYD